MHGMARKIARPVSTNLETADGRRQQSPTSDPNEQGKYKHAMYLTLPTVESLLYISAALM